MLTLLLLGSLCFSVSTAKPLPWNIAPFVFTANNTPIVNVLHAFGLSQGIAVSTPRTLNNNVTGKFYFANPSGFLNLLHKVYGITWYYDGKTLFFYTMSDLDTTVIRLRFITAAKLKSMLQELGIYDTRFEWRELNSENLLQITGPPRYIQAVMGIVQEVEKNSSQDMVMEVFKLKNAWADDIEVEMAGKKVTLPGVATLLRSVTTGVPINQGSVQNRAGVTSNSPKKQVGVLQQIEPTTDTQTDTKNQEKVRILADPRINAVIVWDARERMQYYASTIQKLDIPVPLVEIQVAIVDVNVEKYSAIGTDLSFSTNTSGGTGIGGGLGSDLNTSSILPNITTIYTQGLFSLMARINLLARKGVANVLSRPKILTMNNQEATIQNKSTFYVRVANQDNADLFDVSYGTTVRVTPHVVDSPEGNPSIKLTISIEDGAQSDTDTAVDDIPGVNTSSVSTQAIVGNNNSLIIGGHYYERTTRMNEGIPYIKDAPVVGNLFGKTVARTQKMERLFIITPRIVNIKDVAKHEATIPPLIHNTIDYQEIAKDLNGPGCTKAKPLRKGIMRTA